MNLTESRESKSGENMQVGFWTAAIYVIAMLTLTLFSLFGRWRSLLDFRGAGTVAIVAAATASVVVGWYFTEYRLTVDLINSQPELRKRLTAISYKRTAVLFLTLGLISVLTRLLK